MATKKSQNRSPTISSLTDQGLAWIDVQEPTLKLLKELQKQHEFAPLDLEDTLSPVQRPKMEVRESYIFLVFRFMLPSKKTNRLIAVELDVFLYKNKLITIHKKKLSQVRAILSDAKLFKEKRAHLFALGSGHLLNEILRKLFEKSFKLTDQISSSLEDLEAKIFRDSPSKNVINEISDLRRSVIDFRKIAKPQATFLNNVIDALEDFLQNDQKDFWRNLIDLTNNQWEILETQLETIIGLAATHDSLVGNRLNETFRLLTIISVLFYPITFILDIIGSRVPGNPFIKFDPIFLVIVGILLVTELGFIWFLRRKRVL